MKMQPIVQGTLQGMAMPRHGWWLALGSVRIEPASRSVADYLRVNAAIPDHGPLSPAEQSVADYLRAHGAGAATQTQSVPDAATQGVSDYLRAHAGVPAQNPPN